MSNILAHSRFVEVQPLSAATRSNFSNEVQFQFTVPSGKMLVLNESYLSVLLTITGTALDSPLGDVGTATRAACLSSNPISCLFSKIVHKINDVRVSELDMVPQASTMSYLISTNKPSASTTDSDNPLYVRDTVQLTGNNLAANDVAQTNALQLSTQMMATNAQKQLIASYKTIRLNWTPNTGLFDTDDTFPGNTRHNITFTIDTNWFRQIAYGVLDINGLTADASSWLTTRDANAAVNFTINSIIEGIAMYFSIHDSYTELPPQITYDYSDKWITSKSFTTNNEKLTFMIPASTYKIVVGFVDSRYGTNPIYCPTKFSLSSTLGNNIAQLPEPGLCENLQEIGITYAGESLPETPYAFTGGLIQANEGLQTSCVDIQRAFRDFMINSDALADNGGSFFNVRTWAANPLFCWRVYKPKGDTSRDLTVKLRLNAAVTNVLCVVMCLYKKSATISFSSDGMVTGVISEEST